ncbi:MAG: iron ABC transporter permease [Spirochaetaceae bacterium]|nr:MAG: iron ABC transporter permease [Spirochaetaceae bacterium]
MSKAVIDTKESWIERILKKDWTPYVVFAIPLIFLSIFLFWPLVTTLLRAFLGPGFAMNFENLGTENFSRFFTSRLYQRSLRNSLIIGFAVVVTTAFIGIPMGYCVARVKMPFKNLLLSLGILPIIMPSFIGAFSWIILLGRQGVVRLFLNTFLTPLGIEIPSIYGLFGIIFTMSLALYPFVFLLSYGAFSSANPLLEEAAMMMGSSRWRIMRTITLPLVIPSLGASAILVFIRSIGNFGIPAILGGEQYVLPTLIYFRVNGFWDLNGAAAIATVSIFITGGMLLLQKFVISRREYETISASRSEHKLHTHWAARLFATLYCGIVLLLSMAPNIAIIIMSFFERWRGPYPEGFTWNNYLRIPQVISSEIFNSLYLAVSASIITAVLGCLIAYIVERRRPKGAIILDLAVMAPFILPGIVVSVALLSAFSSGSILALGGTYTIIIISFTIRRTPYVFRSVVASLSQLDETLEESSMISGANWVYTFRRVSLPLIMPGILAGTILTFATLLQELSTTVLLYSARTRTVPIQIFAAVQDGFFGEGAAMSVMLLVTVFIVVYIMNRMLGRSVSSSFKLG